MARRIFIFIVGLFSFSILLADEPVFDRLPKENKLIYDYANILADFNEGVSNYLQGIRDRWKIQAIIVTVPFLKDDTIQGLAVKVMNNWQVGKITEGRGILLLLSNAEKQVKLEVAYNLEDVFTDAFCHYVENLQLPRYFLSGQLGVGLVAVMEEIDNRAAIKYEGNYTADSIKKLDQEFVSGGAGAKTDLKKIKAVESKPANLLGYPAAGTPEEAWNTVVKSWKDKIKDPNLDVYSDCTKLIFKLQSGSFDSMNEKNFRDYGNGRAFKVLTQPLTDNYAVIFFSGEKGWTNTPFFFARINDKWKWDVVHMRKYLRYGTAPDWGIEFSDYNPYLPYLYYQCDIWRGQDIPLEDGDVYNIEEDSLIAGRIMALEEELKSHPASYASLVELGHLYTLCSAGPGRTLELLKEAIKINEEMKLKDPLPYKYMAIFQVDMFYQYNAAIEYLTKFLNLSPKSIFGHNFLGYLYYLTKQYEKARVEFKKSIELNNQNPYCNCYAYDYMIRSYLKIGEPFNRVLINSYFEEMKKQSNCNPFRLGWLEHNLKKRKLIE